MNVCTAVGAIDSKKNYTITFKSEAHKIFYLKYLPECRYQDVYHKALVYCLGIDADTRNHVNRIYDFKTGCVKTKCLNEGCLSISDYGLGRRLPRILRMNSDKKRSNPLTDDESISVTAHVITNITLTSQYRKSLINFFYTFKNIIRFYLSILNIPKCSFS